jgi:hypothetical protein
LGLRGAQFFTTPGFFIRETSLERAATLASGTPQTPGVGTTNLSDGSGGQMPIAVKTCLHFARQ